MLRPACVTLFLLLLLFEPAILCNCNSSLSYRGGERKLLFVVDTCCVRFVGCWYIFVYPNTLSRTPLSCALYNTGSEPTGVQPPSTAWLALRLGTADCALLSYKRRL